MHLRSTALMALSLSLGAAHALAQEPPAPVRCEGRGFRVKGSITSVAWSPDGGTIIGTDTDGVLVAWDLEGRERWTVTAGRVATATWSAAGELLTFEGKAIVRRAPDTGVEVKRVRLALPGRDDERSPERIAQVIHLPGGDLLVSTFRCVRVHDAATGEVKRVVYDLPEGRVPELGRGIAVACGIVAVHTHQDTVLVELESGRELRRLPGGEHTTAASPDGKLLMIGHQAFEPATGAEAFTIPVPEGSTAVAWQQFSADGGRLLLGWYHGGLATFDRAGKPLASLWLPGSLGHHDVSPSPDGARLAVGIDSGVLLVDARTLTIAGGSTGHLGEVTALGFQHDGKLLTANRDGTLRRWNTETGAEDAVVVRRRGSIDTFAIDRAGRTFAVGGLKDEGGVELFSVDGGAPRHVTDTGAVEHGSLAFDATGERLLVEGQVHGGPMWAKLGDDVYQADVPVALAGDAVLSSAGVHDLATREQLRGPVKAEHERVLCFAPTGRHAVLSYHRALRAVDLVTSTDRWAIELPFDPMSPGVAAGAALMPNLHDDTRATFSDDGALLAVSQRTRIVVLDAATGGLRLELPLPEPSGSQAAVAFSGDGRRLAAGTTHGASYVWTLPAAVAGEPLPALHAVRPPRALERMKGRARLAWPGDQVIATYSLEDAAHLADFEHRGFARPPKTDRTHGLELVAGRQPGLLRHGLPLHAPLRVSLKLSLRVDDARPRPPTTAVVLLLGDDLALLWGEAPCDPRTFAPADPARAAAAKLFTATYAELQLEVTADRVIVRSTLLDEPLLDHPLARPLAGPVRLGLAVRDAEVTVEDLRIIGGLSD